MILVKAQRRSMAPSAVSGKTGRLWMGGPVFFIGMSFFYKILFPILRDNDNIKDPSIKESDVINITLFDAGVSLNLMEV